LRAAAAAAEAQNRTHPRSALISAFWHGRRQGIQILRPAAAAAKRIVKTDSPDILFLATFFIFCVLLTTFTTTHSLQPSYILPSLPYGKNRKNNHK
jgi:hypothetical protein